MSVTTRLEHELGDALERAQRFVDEHETEVSLEYDVELEAANHLHRIWIQGGAVREHVVAFLALCDAQRPGGGWGETRDDEASRTRQTAFATQMLIRASRQIAEPRLVESVQRGLDALVAAQHEDGSWRDDRWHELDATSVSVGTLLFAVNQGETATDKRRRALDHGMAFVERERNPEGLWSHRPGGSPVEITAHFLQKLVPYGSPSDVIVRAMEGVLHLQDPVGYWDGADVDATCDALRALMLGASTPLAEKLRARVGDAAGQAFGWLLGVERDGGWGRAAGATPNVLYTCDVIDSILKLRLFHHEPARLVTCYR
jgi:Prenyltransferase and squalene oxidase repeat